MPSKLEGLVFLLVYLLINVILFLNSCVYPQLSNSGEQLKPWFQIVKLDIKIFSFSIKKKFIEIKPHINYSARSVYTI